jgi:hypothetical protein
MTALAHLSDMSGHQPATLRRGLTLGNEVVERLINITERRVAAPDRDEAMSGKYQGSREIERPAFL